MISGLLFEENQCKLKFFIIKRANTKLKKHISNFSNAYVKIRITLLASLRVGKHLLGINNVDKGVGRLSL
jgi:hypothetical protein